MSSLFGRLIALLYPPKCPFCRAVIRRDEDGLCSDCQKNLPWLTGAEAEQKPDFCALCVSPLRYQGAVREAVLRMKFGGLSYYARCFGTLTAQCVSDHLAGRYDIITWVPLSKRRLAGRGYDQARLIAERVAERLDADALPILRKVREVTAQSSISEESGRRANVLGAYEVPDPSLIAGRRVLLIDDVVTSAATLSECAGVLRAAGAAQVVCATVARAGE